MRSSVLALLLVALATPFSQAADQGGAERVRFEPFTVAQGLSQSTVRSIAQDEVGFLWFATQDGLSRFDGYEFQVFRHDPDQPGSLPDNHIHALAADAHGAVWIGSQTGTLARWDPSDERFQRVDPELPLSRAQTGPISALMAHPWGGLWIGTHRGQLIQIPEPGGSARDITGQFSAQVGSVRRLSRGSNGEIWVASAMGLWRVAADGSSLAPVPIEGMRPELNAVVESFDGDLLLGTADQGVLVVGPDGRIKRRIGTQDGLPNEQVRDLLVDRGGRLWIATVGGLAMWDAVAGQLYAWLGDLAQVEDSLSASRLEVLFEDRDGLIWVGTWVNGVNVHEPRTEAFAVVRPQPGSPAAIGGFTVPDMAPSRDGGVWMVVQDAGEVVRYVPGEGVRERIAPSGVPGISRGVQIRSVVEQGDQLWLALGTAGLLRRDADGALHHIERHEMGGTATAGAEIYNLYVDDEQGLWVATLGDGVFGLCAGCDRFEHLDAVAAASDVGLPGKDVSVLHRTRDGSLWIGTRYAGLGRYIVEDRRFERYAADPSRADWLGHDSITCLFEDREDRLWVGTQGGGFYRVERDAQGAAVGFERRDRRHGLGADAVGSIQQDDAGMLWLSTTANLARFDPATKEIETFSVREGAVRGGYFVDSSARLKDGQLMFGGLRGASLFDPRDVHPPPPPRAVTISDVRLPQRGRTPGASSIRVALTGTQRLDLPPGIDAFSLDLTSLSFSAPGSIRFQYRLDPLDRDWSFTDASRRFASYTHVPPGEYLFRARAQRGDGDLSEELELPIRVERVWTGADWARAIALGMATLLAAFVVVLWLQRQRERARADASLRESEARLKLALWGTGDELWDLDLATRHLHRENPIRYVRSFGENDVDDARSLRAFVHPDDIAGFDAAFEGLLAGKSPVLDELVRVRHVDDSWVWLRVRGRIAGRDAVGRPERLTGTITDLTELKSQQLALQTLNDELESRVTARTRELSAANESLQHAMSELTRAQDQLVEQEKMAALGGLVAGVAHEINTPLGISVTTASHLELMVKGLQERLEAGHLARPELNNFVQLAGEAAEMILRNLRRADTLVRSFKQVAVDQSLEEMRTIDLGEYLGEVLISLRPALRKAGVQVDMQIPEGIMLATYPGAIYRVFANLVQNALIHGFATSIEGARIDIRAEEQGDRLKITFRDNGAGMSEEVRRRIFEPFFTTRRGSGGSGLGMHIVFNTVTRMLEGHIHCESRPGEGVEFVLDLPVRLTGTALPH